MEAFVITLREGIEAALVIGIVLAFVRRASRPELGRWVLAGAGTAVLFSAAAALVLSALGLGADNPAVEGVLFSVAAVAVVSTVAWMWRNGRAMRGSVETKVGAALAAGRGELAVALGLFGLSFFMVAREGVETVLFLSAALLGGTSGIAVAAGGAAGIAVAVLYGYLFARGSARVDLRLFFTLTSVALVLLAIKLLGGAIHEFEEAGMIPMSETLAHAFDWFAESTLVDWLFLVALAVPLATPLLRRWRGPRLGEPAAE